MSDFNPTTNTPNKNSKTKLIVIIAAIVLVVVAVAGYAYVASAQNMWPFTKSDDKQTEQKPEDASAKDSLSITKLETTGTGEDKVLQVSLELKSEDKGHCVLELSSNKTSLTIDDEKNRKDNPSIDFEDCKGWSLGVSKLPAGEYTAKVTFKGADGDLTASKKITLK